LTFQTSFSSNIETKMYQAV